MTAPFAWKRAAADIGKAAFWICVVALAIAGLAWVREYLMKSYWAAHGMEPYADRGFASPFKFYSSAGVVFLWTALWLGYTLHYGSRVVASIKSPNQDEADLVKRFLAGLACFSGDLLTAYLLLSLEGPHFI